jgi:DNA modification methylase
VVPPAFASTGVRERKRWSDAAVKLTELAEPTAPTVARSPLAPVLERISSADGIFRSRSATRTPMLVDARQPAPTPAHPATGPISAGKNTYTYDAHTYHTKVPPQGIAELLRHYLPEGGLVLDPFAGSGMTGVAASTLGLDCVLRDLSPAACFIADRFLSDLDPAVFGRAVDRLLAETADTRAQLYTTDCRECGQDTELLYTVWSTVVGCPACACQFNLWDVCRRYGRIAREHKILSEFDCPSCAAPLKKSRLARIRPEPVLIGYICCGNRRIEVTHQPNARDLGLIERTAADATLLADGWYPSIPLPDGVSLRQPKNHGLDRVDRLYTPRNLAALSQLWRTIHRFEDAEVAAGLAFVFTSLYRRVSRLSEFRFWGGSGNTPRLNVPFIFDEPNVFVSFRRKANTILDHLETTARHYRGRVAIEVGSATDLAGIPDNSVDLVFTDPPFGANINYSEMNFLWEAWLGRFTDAGDEAIVNRVQHKDVAAYEGLMGRSLAECFRVLRPGHWMLMVFMNSAASVWEALRRSIADAGFVIVQADVFDKRHGTFKHFVSENTAGADLVLHCLKPAAPAPARPSPDLRRSVADFLRSVDPELYRRSFRHVARADETDVRRLYSQWVAETVVRGDPLCDFVEFRATAERSLYLPPETL